ncbi:B12-binding domain-containing radical SAM protein [Pedosphaera parvula]|uniref:Radical SAM domain protein n=1 Tax=Pedosphaera parvula (strain Ellin514) TaxID=320771 RepID=B9XRK9_PEDPL|nr:radical SAM protein [Pedosphaera parvula]EEF57528.1 Radical SAM domain protein [Pedosphaera parvula Ellin514]
MALFNLFSPAPKPEAKGKSKILWLDMGDLGTFVWPSGPQDKWQDHGMGLLRTILHNNGVQTDMFSLRSLITWKQLYRRFRGYDMLLMNVRSYTFPFAFKAAKIFKEVNPKGLVIAGGMHATVAPDEMVETGVFDRVCQGAGENTIVDLVKNPMDFPQLFKGVGAKSMAEWPMMDRTLWPNPRRPNFPWPLEPKCGWGPGPVATIMTSRVCPWQCTFCNESSFIPAMGRKPVDQVIDELNYLDRKFGPLGSVVIHDSMFFQNPPWLREWLEKYPTKARKVWPYWAAGRADTVRQWPDMFEALLRETKWTSISIGFESGSDRVLKILNKECTAEDNYFAIDLLNRVADDLERQGKEAPRFWSNIMLGIPGETREDAFDTIRMLRSMRRVMPSIAYYAPYPGSALGYQLIAEGKSLMSKDNYHRNPNDEKVKGIDYKFYKELLAGKYDAEVNRGLRKGISGQNDSFADRLVKA